VRAGEDREDSWPRIRGRAATSAALPSGAGAKDLGGDTSKKKGRERERVSSAPDRKEARILISGGEIVIALGKQGPNQKDLQRSHRQKGPKKKCT